MYYSLIRYNNDDYRFFGHVDEKEGRETVTSTIRGVNRKEGRS